MKTKLPLVSLFVIVGIGVLLVNYTVKKTHDLTPSGKRVVKFQLQWSHQGQFAGFYLAKKRGFFDQEGLDVQLVQGGFNIDPLGNLIEKQVDIAMQTGDQILMRADSSKQADIVALGSFFSDSAACVLSLTNKPIHSPADMIGKKIAVFMNFDTDNLVRGILHSQGIGISNVTLVSASGSIEQLLRGDVDAYGAYIFNEPVTLTLIGVSNVVMRPKDLKLTFVSDTVVTTRKYASENKDTVERFMRASAKGWAAAKLNPLEALDAMNSITGVVVGSERDREHSHRMTVKACELVELNGQTAEYRITRDRWSQMATILKRIGRISQNLDEQTFLQSE